MAKRRSTLKVPMVSLPIFMGTIIKDTSFFWSSLRAPVLLRNWVSLLMFGMMIGSPGLYNLSGYSFADLVFTPFLLLD